jgi:alkanesulfonate monooxygenase SsuD/methylene tetrahydromethanopterin reductase-like flavin-dependent oxidoreductase (luciferase family)
MHVGMAAIFQNPDDRLTDYEVYRNDLRLAELAEPLGFQSVWSVEHHFTDYTMCPDPTVFLSYMAGRTRTIQLGSMVIVLPWHDPLRVAEQVAQLDHLSDGRFIFGMGRGAGKVEFDGFRLDMGESRERFVEYAEAILNALETGYMEYRGKYVNQPRVAIRPKPHKSFKGRTFAAAVSPESVPIMSKLGVGLLVIPQKPWDEVKKELEAYRAEYRKLIGAEPPPPIAAGWTFVDESADRAYEMARRYIGGYWHTVLKHYQFAGHHLKTMKGYEYYGKFADKLQQYGVDGATEFFLSLQVWGTPEMVYEKIVGVSDNIGSDSFVGVFSYAGMPPDEAERNMRLFAAKVMPELQKLPTAAERRARHAA